MARVEVEGTSLVVHVEGVDRILALKSTVTIPLQHVAGVDKDVAEAKRRYLGLRLPGTYIPGVVTAGTYLKDGAWTFWDVHDPDHAIVISLHDEHFAKLVIGVDDPVGTAAMIEETLGRR